MQVNQDRTVSIVILLATVSTLAAAIMGACVKYLSNDINTFIICIFNTI